MTSAPDAMESSARRYRVWDAPTRIFHLLVILLVAAQYASAEFHLLSMTWHYRCGYALIALLLFRLLWGFVGSQTSRYAQFLRGPRAVWRYATRGERDGVGHNPVGGWSVLAMLAVLLVQVVSGLYTSDDISESGPLVERASDATVRYMSDVHGWGRYVLLALIALHVIAVVLYLVRRGDDLVTPMVHGKQRLAADPQLRFASPLRAAVAFLLAVAATLALLWWAGVF